MIETRKLLLAWLVLFVAWMAGSFVVHGNLLSADYSALVTTGMFRSPETAQPMLPFMLLAHVLLAGSLVWIYSRGRSDAPWPGQGLRFGVAVALLTSVPTYLIYYAVQPMPAAVVVKQIVFDSVLMVLLGMLVAWLLRPPARALQ
jgi:uncharacterized membrane protein